VKAWIEGPKRTGPWKVRWREMVNGKWVKKASHTLTDKVAAEAERDAVDLRLAKLAALRPRRNAALLTIPQIIKEWKKTSLKDGNIREHYGTEVERTLTKLCAAQGWTHTNQVTAEAVTQWRNAKARGHTKPTAQLQALMRWARSVLKQPIDHDLLDLKIERPTPRPEPDCLTREQIELIIERCYTFGEAIGAAFEHQALFGCRPADICRLDVSSWNRRTHQLTHKPTKNRSRPSHPIEKDFEFFALRLDRITAGRSAAAPLYLSPTGDRWKFDQNGTSRQMADWYWWHITNKLVEIPMPQKGISCLKDFAITSMEDAGIPDKDKKVFTGHFTETVFQRYKKTNRVSAMTSLDRLGAVHGTNGFTKRTQGADPEPGGETGGTSKPKGQNRGQKAQPAQTASGRKPGKTNGNKRPTTSDNQRKQA
jgi:integrase